MKKSNLQKKLESEGWTWLTNQDPTREVKQVPSTVAKPVARPVPGGLMTCYETETWIEEHFQRRAVPLTDHEIREQFLQGDFKDVRIAAAYDANGIPLPSHRAVYVKR